MKPEQISVFLHCIIQEVLIRYVRKINYFTDVVSKTGALNHSQFVALLEEHETELGNIGYHTAVRWLSLGRALKEFGT